MRKIPGIIKALLIIVGVLVLVTAGAFVCLVIRTKAIDDDYTAVFTNEKYQSPVFVDGVEVITQDVSCGYAVIEMFSSWAGKSITEESLYSEYGKVVTSTGKNFCREMNRKFPEYTTSIRRYLKNTELIDTVYQSLSKGIPVPFEWAALYGDDWTLHYSLIVGMDIPNNRITVANPYGYWENISVEEFLRRTSFESYEGMPWFLRLGFAFGLFEKNTVFSVEKI